MQRLDDNEENGHVWVTYYEHSVQKPLSWDSWVPVKNLEGCVPGCYEVICTGGKGKAGTQTKLTEGTLVEIKK